MERLQRSLSERPIPLTPLELKVDFVDQDGVLRRSSTVTKRMLIRGATVAKLEYLSMESDSKPRSSAVVEPSSVCLALLASRSMSESDLIPREERVRRRTQFQLQLRDRKHSILMQQNTRQQERLQLWHDAVELDPDVETTSRNTAQTPSPRSQTYVDEDGNLRRKSSLFSFATQSEQAQVNQSGDVSQSPLAGDRVMKTSPSSVSLILGKSSPTAPRIRTSLVIEFAQNLIDS